MIKIENVSTAGWEPAIRGARNPMNSWEKSDSVFDIFQRDHYEDGNIYVENFGRNILGKLAEFPNDVERRNETFYIGPNDLKLLSNLAKAGSDEAKFRRMIVVYVDITAPMYWWKEADTYKVGTVRDSCSTMHKIHAKEFTLEDFSWEQLLNTGCDLFNHEFGKGNFTTQIQPLQFLTSFIIPSLNECRNLYLKTKDKKYWWQMIQLLPSSYNQRATLMLNYEVLANMYHARKNHKLDEWREFCKWIETLPYAKELIVGEERITDEQLRARFKSYEDRIRYLEEMSAKEFYRAYDMNVGDISEKLGIPESAVKYFVSDDKPATEETNNDICGS